MCIRDRVNKVYSNIKPIYKAISRGTARVDQTFTPAQYRQALLQSDITPNKLRTITGNRPTSELLNLSEKVIGPTLGDSGTATRLLMQDIVQTPVRTITEKFSIPGLIADAAYSKPLGVNPLQLLIESPNTLVTKPLPAYSGIISQNEEMQRLLNNINE